MTTRFVHYLIGLFLGVLMASCETKTEPVHFASIPQPKRVEEVSQGTFTFNNKVEFLFSPETKTLMEAASVPVHAIKQYTGFTLNQRVAEPVSENAILVGLDSSIKPEGFSIDINSQRIQIKVADYAGTFYACQWLYHTLLLQKEASLPSMHLEDYPTTAYRGAMLDVARSFFPVEEVKKFIDLLAIHRLNHFHWHLTDDQGWRIEIKAYPNLTKIGGFQKEGSPFRDGFYTQEDIKEIIAYAAKRAITVIPEIDLPGHSSAALASYAALGCTGGPYHVAYQPGGVHRDVLCLGNDFTWKFAKDVLAEVAQLFPAPYIHIGGDEVPRDRWKACKKCQQAIQRFGLKDVDGFSAEDLLQGKFNEQMALYLKTLGKKMIGWDEVLSDNIDSSTVIMSWRGLGKGTKALKKGHEVIFSSNGHFYFNNYQSADTDNEPESTGGFLPMSKVFEAEWNTKNLTAEEKDKILGVEACLWTSFVRSYSVMNYKLLPRLAAFSDVAWGNETRDYGEFLNRLPDMLTLYDKYGYVYSPIFFDINAAYTVDTSNKELNVTLTTVEGAEIHYTVDGSIPSKDSPVYTSPLRIKESCKIKALAYTEGGLVSNKFEKEVNVNKATFSTVSLLTQPAERYAGDHGKVLVDGVRSAAFHTTGLWVGYLSDPMIAVIDLGEKKQINEVTVSSFTDMGAYIMGIESLNVAVSDDGTNFTSVAESKYDEPLQDDEKKAVRNLTVGFDKVETRYVKVSAYGFNALPAWHSGAGSRPFLFVDEIEVK